MIKKHVIINSEKAKSKSTHPKKNDIIDIYPVEK